jgi:thymidylate synthase
MENGCQKKETVQEQEQKKCLGYQMRFDLNEGFNGTTQKTALKIYYL